MKLVAKQRVAASRRSRSLVAWASWRERLVTLPTTTGLLVFVLGLASLGLWSERARPEVASISIDAPTPPATRDVQRPLTSYNHDMLERTTYASLEIPEDRNGELAVIIAALREVLLEEGVWPEALPEPQLFLPDLRGGERVAVLDFPLTTNVNVSITQERRLLASLTSTLQRNEVDRVHILIDGRASPTFLGHIALPQELD